MPDSMALHKFGSRANLVHRFIEFMIFEHNSFALTNLLCFGNSNGVACNLRLHEIHRIS